MSIVGGKGKVHGLVRKMTEELLPENFGTGPWCRCGSSAPALGGTAIHGTRCSHASLSQQSKDKWQEDSD